MEQNVEDKNDDNAVLTGYEDASTYSQDALRSILSATRAANELPAAGDDFDYYSTFQGFRALMLKEGKSILSLMTSLLKTQGVWEKFQGRELEEKFDLLIDVNDTLLENVSNHLDEATGLKKSEEDLIVATKKIAINTSWNRKLNASTKSPNRYSLLAAKNITRPQLSFKDKIDNTNTLFVPILKEKPNSIKPLAITLEKSNEKEEFCHPYEWEIEKFTPQEEHLNVVEPAIPKPLEETPLIFVKTKNELHALCDELRNEKEFAVDLEHHSYRSFQGFTCLMQISTREKDYIIDVLSIRSEMYILNEVFTNPKIVKVLHGADMDVLWLQRDFGIYIVNLFDTGQAARLLHFAHLSLSYLLKHFCKLDLDKKFQLADWRIRPLPAEMLKYAREDTHYLLYVYDCLKNNLLKDGNEMKNLLHAVFERSKLICLKKYEKPLFNEDRYLELYKKSRKVLNPRQLYCLKELYRWRDKIARENDESIGYILPNHMLLQIAEALPKEQQGILACCNPIPPLIRQQLNELHTIIYQANEMSLKQLEAPEFQQKAQSQQINNQIDLNNMLHCPHDIHHLEGRSQTLDQSNFKGNIYWKNADVVSSSLKRKPSLTALVETIPKKIKVSENLEEKSFDQVTEIIKRLISPFQRYTITKQQHENTKGKEVENNTKKVISRDIPVQSGDRYTRLNDSVEILEVNSSNILEQSVEILDAKSKDASNGEIDSTPLRKKLSKKQKKRKAENPDISLTVTPQQLEKPPSKKQHTPEVVDLEESSFQPYDYSKADLNAFTGRKKSQAMSRTEKNQKFQTPGRSFGRRRKHVKQATFSKEPKACTSSRNWPQTK